MCAHIVRHEITVNKTSNQTRLSARDLTCFPSHRFVEQPGGKLEQTVSMAIDKQPPTQPLHIASTVSLTEQTGRLLIQNNVGPGISVARPLLLYSFLT